MNDMTEEKEGGLFTCPVMSWIVGALLGFATYLILSGRFQTGAIVSIIAALIVMGLFGFLLQRFFCRGVTETRHPEPEVHEIAADPVAVAEVENITTGDLGMPYGIPERAPEEPRPTAAKPVSVAKTAPEDSVSKADTAHAGDAPKSKLAAKAAGKPVAKDGKPELLKKARAGGADDLKQIKGIGPKLEKLLNTMGVFHFDQIASWRAKEVQWVDDNLEGFKGRVSRDEWVKQARVLAKGGKTEFSKKVEKGGVYAKNKK